MAAQAPFEIAGQCLCGAVAFNALSDNSDVHACHCGKCRSWGGNFWTSVVVPYETVRFPNGDASLKWFRSSDWARRGFCRECGSALFWHGDRLDEHKHTIAVAAGALTQPTGVRLMEHIFVSDKGDYYDIADGLPQKEQY